MLIEGQDFDCSSTGVSYLCAARRSDGEQAYLTLQQAQRTALAVLATTQPIPPSTRDLPVDGRITASTALAVQTVLVSLSGRLVVPTDLYPLLSKTADPSVLVRGVASAAVELTRYIDTASRMPAPSVRYQPAPVLKTIGIIGASVVALGGILAIAHAMSQRASGRVDRSGLLPPPLPSEIDDGGDDGDDGDDDQVEKAASEVSTSAGALLPGVA